MRDDEGTDLGGNLGAGPCGTGQQDLRLVVIDCHVTGEFNELPQVFPVEQGHGLTQVKDERHARLGELARVVQHALAAVGRDDAQARGAGAAQRILDVVQLRLAHCARVEGGDLVVVQVGGDHGLRREGLGQHADVAGGDLQLAQVFQVGLGIGADGGHHHRVAAEHFQRVGDVAGAAAELAAHAGHQERDVQHMDLVRQDVFAEASVERHDGVVGDGAADQAGHALSRWWVVGWMGQIKRKRPPRFRGRPLPSGGADYFSAARAAS
ncbi:hypothetical protein D3C72_1153340 [compost metagenome]